MDAFDADVLIYAGIEDHPLGRRVAALFPAEPPGGAQRVGVGSVLLLLELLSKPLKRGDAAALTTLSGFLARDFGRPIKEIKVTFPADL